MLYYLAVALYVLISLFLIVVVLLQPGKGDGMGSAFGGSSTGTVFGGRGASNVLTKMTTTSAVLFMVLSVILARASADHTVVGDEETASPVSATSAPAEAGEKVDAPKPTEAKPAAAPVDEAKPAAAPAGEANSVAGESAPKETP